MVEIKVFLDESDMYEDKQMYEYIMRYLMHHNIMGATLIKGLAGYGKKHHLHFPLKIGNADEVPLIILFADEEEKVNVVLPHIKELINEGLIMKTKIEMV